MLEREAAFWLVSGMFIFISVKMPKSRGRSFRGSIKKKWLSFVTPYSIPIVVVETARMALSRDTEFACIEIYIFTCFAFH